MQIIIDIPKKDYIKIKNYYDHMGFYEEIDNISYTIAKGIVLPQNPTNGDMIKAMFKPYQIFVHTYHVNVYLTEDDFNNGNCWQGFDMEWWNAPYERSADSADANRD